MLRKLVLLVAALVVLPACAADVTGVQLDDKVTVGGQQLVLNGAGVRTALVFFKVYVGSLYLPSKARLFAGVVSQSPRRIQLNMLRDLSNDRIVVALIDGMKEGNDEATLAAVKEQRDQFVAIIRNSGDVKEGAIVTFDYVDGETRIGLNGATKGIVSGEAFNRALTTVWIGDAIQSNPVKTGMLGE